MATDRTDEELLSEFVTGKSTGRRRGALALGILGGRRDLACDAVQETWLRVIRFGSQFSGRSRFKTWLYRIAINQCRTLAAMRTVAPLEPALIDRAAPASTPSGDREPVRRAVAALDDPKRAVVLLCYHNGLTHEQAAEILEVPLGTLKSRLHAALTDLRAALSAEATP
jgi:RNA polymerase sigma-70 factor (ECF subfamily)